MIESKIVFLYWKNLYSAYAIQNKDVFVETVRTVGSSLSASKKMISNSDEMKVLMPEILGFSPTSPEWDTRLAHYWDSLSEDIPVGGKTLEIGFEWGIDNVNKIPYIDAYNKGVGEGKKIKSNQDISDYFKTQYTDIVTKFKSDTKSAQKLGSPDLVEKAINIAYKSKYDSIENLEKQKYKFGTPLNVAEYILYRYCLVYSHVANEYALLDKSNNIRFYLHSEEELKAAKDREIKLERDRMTAFLEVTKSPEAVENILYVFGLGNVIKGMDSRDKDIELNRISVENPVRFISVANNKNLQTIAKLEKLISVGILRRLENTQIIVDGVDASLILGNTLEEAVAYVTNEKNKQHVSDLTARYKGLPTT